VKVKSDDLYSINDGHKHAETGGGLKNLPWFLLVVVLIVLDQYTKGIADGALEYGQPVRVFSWLNMTLQYNPGAAFSFLADAGGWQRYFFSTIAAIVSIVLAIWLYRLPSAQRLLGFSLALILAGAIGNLWDRIVLGHVIDFISVHYKQRYFPAFNIADSAISIGAVCMILDALIHRDQYAAKVEETHP